MHFCWEDFTTHLTSKVKAGLRAVERESLGPFCWALVCSKLVRQVFMNVEKQELVQFKRVAEVDSISVPSICVYRGTPLFLQFICATMLSCW